jgi:hypothetical protein
MTGSRPDMLIGRFHGIGESVTVVDMMMPIAAQAESARFKPFRQPGKE